MKEDWKECIIGDICSKITSGGTPKSSNTSFYDGSIPWLNTKEVNFNRIYSTEKTISQVGYDNSSAKWIPKNSVIVAMYGATAGRVAISKIELTTNQACCNLIIDSNKADYNFIYYHLCNSYLHLSSLANGGAQQNLNANQIREYPINLPSLPTQQKIAAVLSSLDDKIELNNRINQNLEQQAQVIFKSWFVDFEPFGGKMPEGWKVGKLSDLITVKYGKDHKKLNDGNYPVYGSGGIMRYVEKFLYDKESVLIPRKGTLNNVFYINEPFWSVDTMFYTEMKKENMAKYVYFFVKGKDLNSMNAGSAVPSMTTEILNAIEVVIPSDEYLEKFENIVSHMFKQIKQCIIENENLTCIRDTLLPKLMNGEIEVEGIVL